MWVNVEYMEMSVCVRSLPLVLFKSTVSERGAGGLWERFGAQLLSRAFGHP